MWGRKGLVIAGFLGLLGLGAITMALWGYCRDPVWSLPPPEHGCRQSGRLWLHRITVFLSTSRSTENCWRYRLT